MSLSVSCRHNAGEVARELSDLADRIERVPEEAMPEVVALLKTEVAGEIQAIAGGVYWDIETDVDRTSSGTRGSVWTDRSKPHRIEPTKPHGLLVFEKGGQTIFVHGGIDHPGSKPVDWIPGVSRNQGVRNVFSDYMKQAVGGTVNLAAPVGAL